MSSGIKVWDSSGNNVFDSTTLLGRVLGLKSYGTTTGNQLGTAVNETITDDGLLTGTPWYIAHNNQGLAFLVNAPPGVSFSGNTMTIIAAATAFPFTIIYGVR